MAVVAFANNQVMVAEESNPMEITTDPYPTRGINYGDVVLNVHSLFEVGGSVATVTYTVQGSNDGQTWFDVGTFSDSRTSSGTSEKGEDITCAFIRLKFDLAITGASAWGSTAFDLHMNLLHK